MATFSKLFRTSFVAVLLSVSCFSLSILRWDWEKIDTNQIDFPKEFLFGVATSAAQVEGGCTNHQHIEHEGTDRMPEVCGDACDHWNLYKEDVQLIKNLNANAYRFSVEWSKIEPQEGVFDEDALQHYVDVCDELLVNGISPIVTIHHYTEPKWFADCEGGFGGFTKMENIKYYVRFAEKLFEYLGDRVDKWITFSSPVGHAMPSFAVGKMPPYKKDVILGLKVIKNMLEAHVQAYQAIKKMPGGGHAQIGITQTIHQLDPVSKIDLIAKFYSFMGGSLTSKAIYNFFKKGIFKAKVPFKANIKHVNKLAPKSLDFIALSYYSHCGLKGWGKRAAYPGEKKVWKEGCTIYAEGMYRALKELHKKVARKLNIPIIVTENGVAPFAGQEQDRDLFLKRYTYAVSKAIADGIDVRGYVYWSLMDNYEWGKYHDYIEICDLENGDGECEKIKINDGYGLYHVDFETQQRTLKPSAQYFIDVAGQFTPSPKGYGAQVPV